MPPDISLPQVSQNLLTIASSAWGMPLRFGEEHCYKHGLNIVSGVDSPAFLLWLACHVTENCTENTIIRRLICDLMIPMPSESHCKEGKKGN